jgi:hypothetical protein
VNVWLRIPFLKSTVFFSASEIRRMQDVRYCLVLVATLLSTYFNRDNDIEAFLTKYNESFEKSEEILNLLQSSFKLIESLGFPNDSRLFKKADLFTVIVELSKLTGKHKNKLEANEIAKTLGEFFSAVDSGPESKGYKGDVATYHKAALQATNDRSSRMERGKIISKLIRRTIP